MNWQQIQYSSSEGSVLRVCAVQLEPTEKEFSIGITALASEGIFLYV